MTLEQALNVDAGGIQKQQNDKRDLGKDMQVIFAKLFWNEIAPRNKQPRTPARAWGP